MFKVRDRGLVAFHRPDSIISEQFRAVRTHLEFSFMEQRMGTLLITSPEMGDGKSTTVTNLASSLVQQGRRVLVIDADLRKPSIHATFNLTNSSGLTEVLLGKMTFQEIIKKTIIPRLDVITSGSIPLNPAELLGSSLLKSLLENARGMYDTVILDTAPVLEVTDARVLANQCDGVVLVLCKGKTKNQAAAEALRLLEIAKAKLVGVILNQKA